MMPKDRVLPNAAMGTEPSENSTSHRLSEVVQPSSSLLSYITPAAEVSAFCRAVLSKIIPDEFWGSEDVLHENKRFIMSKVDHFVHLRKFESFSLHEALQHLKVCRLRRALSNGASLTKQRLSTSPGSVLRIEFCP